MPRARLAWNDRRYLTKKTAAEGVAHRTARIPSKGAEFELNIGAWILNHTRAKSAAVLSVSLAAVGVLLILFLPTRRSISNLSSAVSCWGVA